MTKNPLTIEHDPRNVDWSSLPNRWDMPPAKPGEFDDETEDDGEDDDN